MDRWTAKSKCSGKLRAATVIIFKAAEDARVAGMFDRVSDLENIAEELIYLRRQVLELPPQSSTALASEEDGVPF